MNPLPFFPNQFPIIVITPLNIYSLVKLILNITASQNFKKLHLVLRVIL